MGDRHSEAPESRFDLTRTQNCENYVYQEMGKEHEEVRFADTTKSPPLTPIQDEKVYRKTDCEDQGRQQGKSAIAPITPAIGAIAYNFDDIHGAKAVGFIEINDLTHRVNNTLQHEDLVDRIRRLEEENRAIREENHELRATTEEDIKDAKESVQVIAALRQRLEVERDHRDRQRIFDDAPVDRVIGPISAESRSKAKPPRASIGGATFRKDSMTAWTPSPRSNESELSRNETPYVQAKFGEGVNIGRENFENATKMNEAKHCPQHNSTVSTGHGVQSYVLRFRSSFIGHHKHGTGVG